jgi:HPt (histidine-containing phosphotransfer) domain-containing protein
VRDEVDFAPLLELRELQPAGAPDVVARILTRFFTESDERLTALQHAVQAGDPKSIERSAHALKGVAGTVGAHAVGDLALRLEHLGREGCTQDAAPLVMELDSALRRARARFERLLLETNLNDRT